MGFDTTLKLEFADLEDTVLYLGNACPVEVRKYDDGSEDYGKYKLSIFADEGFVMRYKDKEKRDIDYNYAIEQIDMLMNIYREDL